MPTRGVVLYNAGQKMLVRLAVTLTTLRRHWDGPVTVVAEPDDGKPGCEVIASALGADLLVPKWKTATPPGDNWVLLNKCLLHEVAPYDLTCLIDADCTVHGRIDPIFDGAEDYQFCVCRFSDWQVKGKIAKRVQRWRGIVPDAMLERALRYEAAINTGVYAFDRYSALMGDWHKFALQGRGTYIPDETCCQVMLASYPHQLEAQRFNVSCKYGLASHFQSKVIVHYHGRKHCRIEPNDGKNKRTKHHLTASWNFLNASELWWPEFHKLRHKPYVEPYVKADRQLRHYLPRWKKARAELEGAR